MRRAIIVKDHSGKMYLCQESVNKRYFYPLGELIDTTDMITWTHGEQKGCSIIRFSETNWCVTGKEVVEGVKKIWIRCSNEEFAQRMMEQYK